MIKYFAKYLVLPVLSLLLVNGAAAGTIYRSVDSNGQVSFSDQPPAADARQAATVEIRGANSYSNPIPRAPYEPGSVGDETVSGKQFYSSLAITYPADDTRLRNNAGNVKVGARLAPGLRGGDKLVLVLDGQQTDFQSNGTEFVLTNVPRGTHRVGLVVLSAAGEVLVSSTDRIFHLQRFAPALAPQAAPPPPPSAGSAGAGPSAPATGSR